jgi:hypothetical protein
MPIPSLQRRRIGSSVLTAGGSLIPGLFFVLYVRLYVGHGTKEGDNAQKKSPPGDFLFPDLNVFKTIKIVKRVKRCKKNFRRFLTSLHFY